MKCFFCLAHIAEFKLIHFQRVGFNAKFIVSLPWHHGLLRAIKGWQQM